MGISRRGIRFLGATALSIGLVLAVASAVFAAPAHAKVIASDPAANSTLAQAPSTITVTTAENMKPGATNSNLFVYGPNGDLVSQGDATSGLSDPKQMSTQIKGSGNGVYVVRWITVSADDGDPDQGAFVFTVGVAHAAQTQATRPNTTTSSGTPLWGVIVAAIVALLVGVGVGVGVGRSSKGTAAAAFGSVSTDEKTPSRR